MSSKNRIKTVMPLTLLLASMGLYARPALAADMTSVLLTKSPTGHLQYVPDKQGNRVPDFSYVGYHDGEVEIPVVPVIKTISPVSGDNLKNIQDAVNQVSAMPLVNGFRGAVLLKPGTYNISNHVVISASGVVIRGSGVGTKGTRVVGTAKSAVDAVFVFSGSGSISLTGTTANLRRKKIAPNYTPSGTRELAVSGSHAFKVGDRVILSHTHNAAWVSLLGMGKYGWSAGSYSFQYKRKVTAINGNTITIDAPLVEQIDKSYGDAELIAYDWSKRIEHVGIENIELDSTYTSPTDEKHTQYGVLFINTENAWTNKIDVYHIVESAVSVESSSSNISVLNSRSFDPISRITGGRRYSFNIAGQRSLVKGCYARKGRHDYVTGARTAGPNVFVDSQAVNQLNDMGPHQRWAVGSLYDNIVGDGSLNVQNRTNFGSGHGWAGAQNLLWGCTTKKIIIQSPPKYINWAIGSRAAVTFVGDKTTVPGYEELTGKNVWPRSLYSQQMCDRLGKFC